MACLLGATLRRRTFLQTAAALALAPPFTVQASPSRLQAAHDGARGLGKPLLVFLVPDTPEGRWAQGSIFADLLRHGSDETLALLAFAEPVFATEAALHLFRPPMVTFRVQRQFDLLETDPAIRGTSIAIWTLMGPAVPYGYQGTEPPAARPTSRKANLGRMAQTLKGGLARDAELLALRAAQVERALRRARLRGLWNQVRKGEAPEAGPLWASGAWLAWRAAGDEALEERVTALLAGATRWRFTADRLSGARWVEPSLDPEDLRPGPSWEEPYLVFDG